MLPLGGEQKRGKFRVRGRNLGGKGGVIFIAEIENLRPWPDLRGLRWDRGGDLGRHCENSLGFNTTLG